MARNNDPVERLKRLSEHVLAESAHRSLSRAQAAAENRARFPEISRVMDSLKVFSPKLTYAREGENEIGRRLCDRQKTNKRSSVQEQV